MKNISEQFYGEMTPAPWINRAMSEENLKRFLNAKPLPRNASLAKIDFAEALEFWMIGPKKGHGKRLFLYGHGKVKNGSHSREIRSINPIKPTLILVKDNVGAWWKLEHKNSLSSIARKLDMFLSGAYTDIPLIHSDFILDLMEV